MALKAHLDPHVLFNTLNAIAEWCREDPAVAERALIDLSSLLRQLLVGVRAEAWALDRELEAVGRFFELYRIRDPERFSVEWRGATPRVAVPPMLLLPLAENAMTHGPGRGHRGVVIAETRRQGDTVSFTLTNPGAFEGRRPSGQGLSTIEQRLRLAYGDDARLEVRAVGATTEARIVWPAVDPPTEEEAFDAGADRR